MVVGPELMTLGPWLTGGVALLLAVRLGLEARWRRRRAALVPYGPRRRALHRG